MAKSSVIPFLIFSMWFGLAACTRNFDAHNARKSETTTGMPDHSGETGQTATTPGTISGSGVYERPDDVERGPASVDNTKCDPKVTDCPTAQPRK